ncbi:MAG: hypothetical protein V2A34_07030 [Lentisphaerota bacterium]
MLLKLPWTVEFHFNAWDVALIAAVATLCVIIAYVHNPRWKVLVMGLPVPFTMATLAVGLPVGAGHVTGFLVFLGFTHVVRLLHYNVGMSIVPAIVISTLSHVVIAWLLAQILPLTDLFFNLSALVVFLTAVVSYRQIQYREEPGHRSPLALWLKLPIIVAVIFALILIKNSLHGFIASCPMVGVVAAYEARRSLYAICRQTAVLLISFVPALVVMRLVQEPLGLGVALAVGWIVFGAIMVPLSWWTWFAKGGICT